jgi:hypothetical protein
VPSAGLRFKNNRARHRHTACTAPLKTLGAGARQLADADAYAQLAEFAGPVPHEARAGWGEGLAWTLKMAPSLYTSRCFAVLDTLLIPKSSPWTVELFTRAPYETRGHEMTSPPVARRGPSSSPGRGGGSSCGAATSGGRGDTRRLELNTRSSSVHHPVLCGETDEMAA